MKSIKINGKKVSIPTNWGEVKFYEAIRMFDESMNNIDVFSMFTGYPVDKIRSEKNQDTVLEFMYGFPFLSEMPESSDMPISVKLDGVTYNLPFVISSDTYDLGDAPVGCIEDMKEVIYQETKKMVGDEERGIEPLEEVKIKPYLVGLYLSSIIGDYDYKKGLELSEKVKEQLSFLEVNSIGNFFLKRLVASINRSKKASPLRLWIKKMYKLACWNLIKLLDFMLP